MDIQFKRRPMHNEASELFHYAHTNPKPSKYLEASYRTLERHIKRGEYDRSRALKLILRNARDVAKMYCMDYADNLAWPVMFPVPAREAWANKILDYFESEIEAGNSYLGSEDNGD